MNKPSKKKKRFLVMDAGIIDRLLAFLIDVILLRFTLFLPFEGMLSSIYEKMGIPANSSSFNTTYNYFISHPEVGNSASLLLLGFAGLVLLYFALMEFALGQTVGKMVLKIAVVSDLGLKKKGKKVSKPTFPQCLLRNIGFIPLFPLMLLWAIDPLFIIFRKDRRRLTELMTATRTMKYLEY